MSANERKTARFSFRLAPETLKRLQSVAVALNTPLADLLVTGALMVWARATNPSEYLRTKSDAIATAATDTPAAPGGGMPYENP